MDVMLTTLDNPFNPFIDYDDWYAFDTSKGYNTCAYLARIAITSDELSSEDEEKSIDLAMKEICELNITGNYVMVTKDSFNARNVDKELDLTEQK